MHAQGQQTWARLACFDPWRSLQSERMPLRGALGAVNATLDGLAATYLQPWASSGVTQADVDEEIRRLREVRDLHVVAPEREDGECDHEARDEGAVENTLHLQGSAC